MSVSLHEDQGGQHRVLRDDINPRIYSEEWKCCNCKEWVHHEEVVWADSLGNLTTDKGKPWCESCLPAQSE